MAIKKIEETTEEVTEEKPKDEYVLVEVPTGSALAVQKPDGNVISNEQAVVEILNIVKDIKKAID